MRAIVPIFGVIVLAIVPALRAQEAKTPVPPTTPAAQPALVVPLPPKVSIAKAETKDRKVMVYYTEFERLLVDDKYTFTEPEGKVTKEGTRKVWKQVQISKVVSLADNKHATFTDATGKALSEDDLLKRLKEPSPIFIFDGKAEEFYLKALKPETVVLVFKSVSIVPKPGSKDDR